MSATTDRPTDILANGRFANLTVELRADRIAVISFRRLDKLNGLTWPMRRDLIEVITQLSYDNRSDVVIITGGEHFSAGDAFGQSNEDRNWEDAVSQRLDRHRHDGLSLYSMLRTLNQNVPRSMKALDKITIAAIDGFCIQSGLSLALACDFRIATPRAKLGSATLRMGYLPDEGGHHLLVRTIGVARTKDFLLRKRIVDGNQALALGLVHQLAEPESLFDAALALAQELAEGPQVAMRLLKHAIDAVPDLTFEQAGMNIALRTAISDHHPDAREGAAAFVAKPRRKPHFNVDRGDGPH
ncbi:MAG: hypothetical protein JWO15_2231 [Sphingomonadales bacterium]|nr:hypothetical protein [Sphingomonadales bacterium]